MCGLDNPLSCPGDAIGSVVGGAAESAGSSAMEGVASFFNEAAEWAVKNLTAAWLNSPSPDVQSADSPTMWLQDRLTYFVGVAMVVAFLVAAYKLATNPQVQHARDLGEMIVRVVLATTVGGLLIATGIEIGEIFSKWILDQADVDLDGLLLTGVTNPGLLLILALVMLLAQLIQLVLMIIRNAMIVYLAAVLPLAAAASSTAAGKQWWSKSVAWLIAFVLYKPVAALIYAGAFRMLDSENNITTQITGVVAVVMAILALPAIMRFIVPATSAMASGNAGAMALGITGAAVATGAVVATGGGAAAAGGGAGLSGATSGMGASSGMGAQGATGATSSGGGSGGGPSGGDDGGSKPSGGTGGNDSSGGGAYGGASGSSGDASGTSGSSLIGAAQSGQRAGQGASDTASGAVEEDS